MATVTSCSPVNLWYITLNSVREHCGNAELFVYVTDGDPITVVIRTCDFDVGNVKEENIFLL